MVDLDFERSLRKLRERVTALRDESPDDGSPLAPSLNQLGRLADETQGDLLSGLSPWQRVQMSRHPDRPHGRDHLAALFERVTELHGDRGFRDDPAIMAALAWLGAVPVVVVAQEKGRNTAERTHRNFGMAHPEGYRKAERAMALAERFQRPLITLIDTAGAYPGIGAEERGQSQAIGSCILTMTKLTVPSVAVILGEGGSGGALALGAADHVAMLEYATYSVITPEGCASILWRDASHARSAAEQLRITADQALQRGLVDAVVEEPPGGAHRDPPLTYESLQKHLHRTIGALASLDPEARRATRYDKFRHMGAFTEP